MKKKLITYIFLAIGATLIIFSFLMAKIFQYKEKRIIIGYLRSNNELMSIVDFNNNDSLGYIKSNNKIRVTYMKPNGDVILDTDMDDYRAQNYKDAEEFRDAVKNGEGVSERYSDSPKRKIIYLATRLKNNNIIRSSVNVDNITFLDGEFLNYFIIVLGLVLGLSLWLANKLTYIIVKPIENLDNVTSRIAKGELDRRVSITSKDELGVLGKNFNYMADKLQLTLSEVRNNQNRLEAVLKCMNSGVIAVDRNYNIIIINPYAERIFGIDRNLVGESLIECVKNYELEKVLLDNGKEYNEFKIMRPMERNLEIRTTDIINKNEHIGTVIVIQDITEMKKLENMRSEFVANVSHELKTPLTSIRGFSETLMEVDDPVYRKKFLGIINSESERLTRLIEDILTLSRVENKKGIKEDIIDVNTLMNEVVFLVKNTADRKNISIDFQGDEIRSIKGDKDKFTQMLINLVDNAVKYTDNGGKVRIKSKDYYNYFTITIQDNGMGIDKKDIDNIFQRFYRVDKARSRADGGTGLGLAIVKHILVLFNGDIEVNSVVGKGSSFTINIPYNI